MKRVLTIFFGQRFKNFLHGVVLITRPPSPLYFSFREKVAAGRMRVKSPTLFRKGNCLIALTAMAQCVALGQGGSVAVLFNSTLPESKAIAEHYAKLRGVPAGHLIGLPLSDGHTISRREFTTKLEQPLAAELAKRKLLDGKTASIRYLVLCWGVPIRVDKDNSLNEDGRSQAAPPLRRNEASVDSELAMLPQLGQAPKRFGFVSNPVFRQADAQQISPANGVLMVARLDGPSPELAKRLVDRAVDAESSGLWGRAYIDLRGISVGQFKVGDDRLRKVIEIMRRSGFATVVDEKPETLPVGFPASHIAFYAGWYGINVEGVFAESTVEFMPGAIAYHLHSFNGSMIRDAHARWIGPFINKGVTATFGTVYEPYLELTPDLPLFFSRLISDGFTFGEAGYASSRALSWQTVFVGDPLYRPFGKSPEEVKAKLEQQNSPMLEWFHLLSVNQGLANGAPAKAAIEHLQQLPGTKGSSVLQEKLGELLAASGQAEAASAAYSAALKSSTSPKQKQRLTEEQGRQQKQAP